MSVAYGYSRHEAWLRLRPGAIDAGSVTFGRCRDLYAAWRQVSVQYFRSGRPVSGLRHRAHSRCSAPASMSSTWRRSRRYPRLRLAQQVGVPLADLDPLAGSPAAEPRQAGGRIRQPDRERVEPALQCPLGRGSRTGGVVMAGLLSDSQRDMIASNRPRRGLRDAVRELLSGSFPVPDAPPLTNDLLTCGYACRLVVDAAGVSGLARTSRQPAVRSGLTASGRSALSRTHPSSTWRVSVAHIARFGRAKSAEVTPDRLRQRVRAGLGGSAGRREGAGLGLALVAVVGTPHPRHAVGDGVRRALGHLRHLVG